MIPRPIAVEHLSVRSIGIRDPVGGGLIHTEKHFEKAPKTPARHFLEALKI